MFIAQRNPEVPALLLGVRCAVSPYFGHVAPNGAREVAVAEVYKHYTPTECRKSHHAFPIKWPTFRISTQLGACVISLSMTILTASLSFTFTIRIISDASGSGGKKLNFLARNSCAGAY